MIELNYDYSSFYENIDEIEKYLLENENDLTVLNFYKYFVNFFPVRKNLKFYFSNTDSLHNLVENGLNDIYSKRNIYKNTVDLFYSEIKRKTTVADEVSATDLPPYLAHHQIPIYQEDTCN